MYLSPHPQGPKNPARGRGLRLLVERFVDGNRSVRPEGQNDYTKRNAYQRQRDLFQKLFIFFLPTGLFQWPTIWDK